MGYKNNSMSYDIYHDVDFEPIIDSLRKISNDTTPLKDAYVSMSRNIYDMIDGRDDNVSDSGNCITNLSYDSSSNSMLVSYKNGTVKTIRLNDKYLFNASYNNLNGIASFILNDGQIIRLDLNELKNNYYEKKFIDKKFNEFNEKIDNKNFIKWNNF